ncbi:MAG TPA: hypothetical protein VH186_18995 [Chloroflexia bacterium]|nr:hypothetical protein [Chloroflexia bacterium]
MPLEIAELERLNSLRQRRPLLDLTDDELLELFRLEDKLAPNPYGQVVAVLSTFPPYLAARPHLIPAFIEALYRAAKAAHRGLSSQDDLREYLESKSQVDNDLSAALKLHFEEFERAIARIKP